MESTDRRVGMSRLRYIPHPCAIDYQAPLFSTTASTSASARAAYNAPRSSACRVSFDALDVVFNNGVVWYCCNRPGWKLAGESAGEGPRPRKHVDWKSDSTQVDTRRVKQLPYCLLLCLSLSFLLYISINAVLSLNINIALCRPQQAVHASLASYRSTKA